MKQFIGFFITHGDIFGNFMMYSLTLSLPEYLMEICKVTLTFESADEIL